ncbi:MAG: hypothetical protein J0I08_07625 [Rhizobiales bacterium]|nr:hypothetical protein [Hyphomicrobiales bacterium]
MLRSDAYDPASPRVRFASFLNEDTGETKPLYLHTHAAIDEEIDDRIQRNLDSNPERIAKLETKRAKLHSELDEDAAKSHREALPYLLAFVRELAKCAAREDHEREVSARGACASERLAIEA